MNEHASIREAIYKRTLADYEFRNATVDDIEGIINLWPEHWEEVHYKDRGMEPNEPAYREWLHLVLSNGYMPFVLALRRGTVIGFFAYSLDTSFSTKPCAIMDKFFVMKAHRRTAVPSILCDLALDMARGDGAAALHAPIITETLGGRGLENMMSKLGFSNIGIIMGKGL
jgi:GNAT superfamily N-acetyltransferase